MEKRYDIPEEKKEMASEPGVAGYRQRTVFSAVQVELLNAMAHFDHWGLVIILLLNTKFYKPTKSNSFRLITSG